MRANQQAGILQCRRKKAWISAGFIGNKMTALGTAPILTWKDPTGERPWQDPAPIKAITKAPIHGQLFTVLRALFPLSILKVLSIQRPS